MLKIYTEDYFHKIILLEKQVGMKTSYKVLEPFSINPKDILSIQNAGKKIAEFIGLSDFNFIIATVKQKEKVGGNIDLKYGEKEVFVEISDNIIKYETAILATLAHEITHKYLHINNVSCGLNTLNKYENEVLTDITSVFLGLGKLMLNGCECENIRKEYLPEKTRTITETMKCGYLNRSQLAFVYLLVNTMRRISPDDYKHGLSSDSIQVLLYCERKYPNYFNKRFSEPDIRGELVKRLHSAIRETQSTLSNVDKNLLYIQNSCTYVIEDFLEKKHKVITKILSESSTMINDVEYDPCLKFLNAVQLNRRISKLISRLYDFSLEAKLYQNSITKITNYIQSIGYPFLQPSLDMFNTVVCRNDGTKLKLPKDNPYLLSRCPNCNYQFIADTSLLIAKKFKYDKRHRIKNLFKLLFKKR